MPKIFQSTLCELSPVPEGNVRTERNPPSCWVSFPRKPFHPNKMGLLYGSSDVPKTVLFLGFVVPS